MVLLVFHFLGDYCPNLISIFVCAHTYRAVPYTTPSTACNRYTFGDITAFVMNSVEERKDMEGKQDQDGGSQQQTPTVEGSILDNGDVDLIAKELEEWDMRFAAGLGPSTNSTSIKS